MNSSPLKVALIGNPNCGKTALFNQLTGARQKVANYPGVTVERKEGRFTTESGRTIRLIDLPGSYSLYPTSPDEQVTYDVLMGVYPGETSPDLIICVADATNLRLHLRFVLEVKRLGRPMLLVLNMMDAAQRRGIKIDIPKLSSSLDTPIVETVAVRKDGARALVQWLDGYVSDTMIAPVPDISLPNADLHAEVRSLMVSSVSMPSATDVIDDAIDRWVLHPLLGLFILSAVMFFVFQAVYFVGKPMTDAIGDVFSWLGTRVEIFLPEGPIRGLLSDGILAGLGTILGFLPEILVLFLFILILEESGYLPRAAFLLDQVMLSVGLSGRSFIPLLSSFACAIPGIMGTRSISDSRDRLTTILVAPLMTCSARLPVYALLIGAFIPTRTVLGIFNLQGVVLFILYLAGIIGAMTLGWFMSRFHANQGEHALLMELPAYRLPKLRDLSIGLWERGMIFVKRLTGVILALTVIMWCISTFPTPPADATRPAIEYSIASYLGHALEVILSPLGFNWQISLSLIPTFAARETAVAALATVYAVGDDGNVGLLLGHTLANNISLASALSLLAWFAFAPQCMSTLAVIRRETRSWWPVLLSFGYMFLMAYFAAFITYSIARALT
ncbi:ferrous iron transporter B [Candidatus Pandoraea novymonadis]|uniref:Ferrous iron transport protein B n=1 Tax=Candidatus Pandoraea novymonadis TaxID=1808959 RepID=A0ABX5FDU2_9BURK|nr:ferrous iron transporter B [Candidatus Pandoraea novymonadis]PSB91899.1 Ferrous iron transport protein B [Candidatus Pandoraea novymonadis]